MTGAPLPFAVCERLRFGDDQRSFHPCGLVSRDRAVEHVLAGFMDLQVNDAAGRLCQREVDIGLLRRLLVSVLPGSTEVRDVDVGVDLVDREVVEGRVMVLNRDLDDVAHLHFEHVRGEGQPRHVDEEQRVLGCCLKVCGVVFDGGVQVTISVLIRVVRVVGSVMVIGVGVMVIGCVVRVVGVIVGRVGGVRRVVNVCGSVTCIPGAFVSGT